MFPKHILTPLETEVNYLCTACNAGLTGLLLAATALIHQSTAPIKHLRNLNPYVGAALGDWEKRAGSKPRLPLQVAPQPDYLPVTGSGAAAGTSSFGMSGVNAHMIVSLINPPQPSRAQVRDPCDSM